MITALALIALGVSALCTTVLVCACIVGKWADENAPRPPAAVSWEEARRAEELKRGVKLVKYFR